MSKEKGCKCCKQIWYVDMLDKKLKLCPNCYEYCKPLIDDLKIKDKKIADIQHRLKVAEKALELACKEITGSCEYCSYKTRIECPVEADCLNEKINYFKSKAKEILENE